MVNYSKAIVYKLCCKDPEVTDIYIGSTCDKYTRKAQHKFDCSNTNRKGYNTHIYQFIREHGGFDNWELVPIEVYPCESKTELIIRERYWFEKLGASLNSQYPQRDIKDTQKEYREKNKTTIAKYKREYNHKNNDKRRKWSATSHEKNKDKIRERQNKHGAVKIICECGSSFRRDNKYQHLKTIKHQTWEQQPEPNLIFVD